MRSRFRFLKHIVVLSVFFLATAFAQVGVIDVPPARASATGTPGPTPDLAWLKTQEGTGTAVIDSIGTHLHNGTLSGSTIPTWVLGQDLVAGHALSFNGTTAYIPLNNSPLIGNSTTGSIVIWFKRSGSLSATETIYGEGSSSTTTPIILIGMDSGGHVLAQVRDDSNTPSTVTSSGTFNDGAWHMITVVLASKSSLKLYVDTTLIGTDTTTRGTQTMNQVSIGSLNRTSNGLFFGGVIADLRAYTIGLVLVDVQNLYASNTP